MKTTSNERRPQTIESNPWLDATQIWNLSLCDQLNQREAVEHILRGGGGYQNFREVYTIFSNFRRGIYKFQQF